MINIDAEGRAIAKALKSMIAKAKAAGIKNPYIFFEAEAMSVYVMDRDHPNDSREGANMGERQEAVVAQVTIGSFGTGAW